MNVFELATQYRELEALVDGGLDLPDEAILATWANVEDDLNTKIENIGFAIKNREAILAGKQEAIKAMEASAMAVEKEIERLKTLAVNLMTATGQKKAGGHALTLSVSPNPPSVEIENAAAIPYDYMRLTEPVPAWYELDKKAIAADLKDGVIVPGAKLKRGVRLTIK